LENFNATRGMHEGRNRGNRGVAGFVVTRFRVHENRRKVVQKDNVTRRKADRTEKRGRKRT